MKNKIENLISFRSPAMGRLLTFMLWMSLPKRAANDLFYSEVEDDDESGNSNG